MKKLAFALIPAILIFMLVSCAGNGNTDGDNTSSGSSTTNGSTDGGRDTDGSRNTEREDSMTTDSGTDDGTANDTNGNNPDIAGNVSDTHDALSGYTFTSITH